MHIVACIKQVPDTTQVRINPETNTLMREGVVSIINPFDMYAIEEAVRLKERFGGKATVITMGPPQADQALREALSMGIDEAILISDRAFAGSDTWATSYVLAEAIKKIGDVDIVLCGKQSADGDTAQVGPGIAVHLNLPQATYVRKVDEVTLDPKPGTMVLERLLEEGYEIMEVQLPAVLTVVKEINNPRIASLKGKMAAKKATIATWKIDDLKIDPKKVGLDGSPTRVVKIFSPPAKSGGKTLTGEPEELATQLVEELKNIL